MSPTSSVTALAASLLALLPMAQVHAQPAADEPLTRLVIVMREGTSVPMASTTELSNWAAQPWPAWNQPPGALTPRGAQAVGELGKHHRRFMAEAAIVTAAGCPPVGSVYVRADQAERTQATAHAFVDGFAPGCGIVVRTLEDGRGDARPAESRGFDARGAEARGMDARAGDSRRTRRPDPLFHPLEAGVCRLDPLAAQARVLERAHGDLNRITRDLKGPFDTLQGALDCCKPALCTAFGRGEACRLADLPTALSPLPEGAGLEMMGALPIGAAAATALFDQYLAGMPPADVAWGRATPGQLRDVMRLSTEQRDLLQRTPYLARKRGSALLHKVAAAVTSARMLGFGVLDPGVRDAAVVLYVGQDSNLWNLASLMDVSWLQAGFQRNQVPPGGALVFEVRENAKDRKLRVYTSFVAQNVEQLRSASPLTGESLPAQTPLRLPGCSSTAPGFPCTLDEFAVAMRNNIDRDCVE